MKKSINNQFLDIAYQMLKALGEFKSENVEEWENELMDIEKQIKELKNDN